MNELDVICTWSLTYVSGYILGQAESDFFDVRHITHVHASQTYVLLLVSGFTYFKGLAHFRDRHGMCEYYLKAGLNIKQARDGDIIEFK